MKPAAVGFDFDHTLGIDNKLERSVGTALLLEEARRAACVLREEEGTQAMEAALRAFRSVSATLEDALREAFAPFAARGMDCAAVVSGFRANVLARAPAFVEALPGARELLAALDRAGVPYALLSNGWSPLQEEKARLIGFRGAVFVSESVGAWKPAPAAFAPLVGHLGIAPERIWYVGDDPAADVRGARDAGLGSVWFDWENVPYPADQPAPTRRIRALAELAEVFTG